MDTDITSAAGIILLNLGDIYVINVKLKDVSILETFFLRLTQFMIQPTIGLVRSCAIRNRQYLVFLFL